MHFLWTDRQRNFFSRAAPRKPAERAVVRALSSLASLDCRARDAYNSSSLPTTHSSRRKHVTTAVHRFEESIGGRPYLIEVAPRLQGPLARLHRPDPRRADRADAVLRRDAGRSRASAVRLADARARARRRTPPSVGVGSGGMLPRSPSRSAAAILSWLALAFTSSAGQRLGVSRPRGSAPGRGDRGSASPTSTGMLQQQAETDKTWRAASDGFMQMEKITYRSRAGDLDIPAFVFQPLKLRGAEGASRASSGSTRTSAAISTSTTFRTSAKRPRRATSSSRRSIAAASATARRSTTRSTTAAPKSTTW